MSNENPSLQKPEVESKSPPEKQKPLTEKILDGIADRLGVPDVPKDQRLAVLTDDQKKQLQEIEDKTIIKGGQIDEVEAALGMLRIGHHFGWKVLYIVHSKKTIRKYEEILGVKIRDIFPEKGPSAPRSAGLKIAETYPNFWKVVSGDIKITDRRKVD